MMKRAYKFFSFCKIFRLLYLLLLLCFFGSYHLKAEPPTIKERLLEIQRQVSQETANLSGVLAEQANLEKELFSIRTTVQDLKTKEQKLRIDLGKLDRDVIKVEKALEGLEEQEKRLQKMALERIRALYIHRKRSNLIEKLLRQKDYSTLLRQAYYLNKLDAHDKKVIDQLSDTRKQNEVKRSELKALLSEQKELLRAIAKQKDEQLEALTKQQKLLKAIKLEKGKREDLVTSLRAQALRLETVVSSLTSSGGGSAYAITGLEEQEKTYDAKSAVSERATAYEGAGLIKYKLEQPVRGGLLQNFGKNRKPEFSDFVFKKGLEFKVETDRAVRAIASGRVMYKGKMPGYGLIVILDHGKRYYSLYGRLARATAIKGSEVSAGQKFAELGSPDSKGRNFYFEIRKNGKPVNPQNYYKTRISKWQ